MSAVLIWIAALLTVTVIAEIVAFFDLNSKISKLKAEKYEAYRKKNGGTGLFSGAVVTFGLPDISLLILSVILAGEGVFLTFEIIKSAKELKKLLAESIFLLTMQVSAQAHLQNQWKKTHGIQQSESTSAAFTTLQEKWVRL